MKLRALVAALALCASAPAALAQDRRPQLGDPYPEFSFPTLDGERTISLSSLRGKRLLLVQFASW